MKMISTLDETKNSCSHTCNRRKPLQLLSGIFFRNKNNHHNHNCHSPPLRHHRSADGIMQNSENSPKNPYMNEDIDGDVWRTGMSSPVPTVPEPRQALHSPYHQKTIDQEMENLRLSRQDNPFLQVLASRECLNESDDCSEYEQKHLMSKENLSGSRDPLTLAEVHARLVRSPPPIWTRGRNASEPSFSHLTSHSSIDADNDDCVFHFPPKNNSMSPTQFYRRNHCSGGATPSYKFLAPFDYTAARMRGNNLEAVLNLSPQPRRRPENTRRAYSSDLSS